MLPHYVIAMCRALSFSRNDLLTEKTWEKKTDTATETKISSPVVESRSKCVYNRIKIGVFPLLSLSFSILSELERQRPLMWRPKYNFQFV